MNTFWSGCTQYERWGVCYKYSYSVIKLPKVQRATFYVNVTKSLFCKL